MLMGPPGFSLVNRGVVFAFGAKAQAKTGFRFDPVLIADPIESALNLLQLPDPCRRSLQQIPVVIQGGVVRSSVARFMGHLHRSRQADQRIPELGRRCIPDAGFVFAADHGHHSYAAGFLVAVAGQGDRVNPLL